MGEGGEIVICLLHRGNLKNNANITECITDKNKHMREKAHIFNPCRGPFYDNMCRRILCCAIQM